MLRLLALGLIALSSGAGLSHQGPAGVSLEGRVTDGSSGVPVEGAEVFLPQLELGSRTSAEGTFLILGVPKELREDLVIRHPCFHTIRVRLERITPEDRLEIGLPYRTPRAADGRTIPDTCTIHGPRG